VERDDVYRPRTNTVPKLCPRWKSPVWNEPQRDSISSESYKETVEQGFEGRKRNACLFRRLIPPVVQSCY
jgi:hypothetical protein